MGVVAFAQPGRADGGSCVVLVFRRCIWTEATADRVDYADAGNLVRLRRRSPARWMAVSRHGWPAGPPLVLLATSQAVSDCVDCSRHTFGISDFVSSPAGCTNG